MEHHLRTPISRELTRDLRAGDVVYISGVMITARDKAHMRMAEYFSSNKELPFELKDQVSLPWRPDRKERGRRVEDHRDRAHDKRPDERA